MRKIHFASVDSTNTYAKKMAAGLNRADREIVLITADEQTAGRGRIGKRFDSRKGNGLYMTVLFPVGKPPQDCLFITVAAAVAVCGILRKYSGENIGIKWVNDLYLGGRKVCGILTEAVTDGNTGIMDRCVLGIGINLDTEPSHFPEELRETVGSVNGIGIPKDQLAEEIAEEAVRLAVGVLESGKIRDQVLRTYREQSVVLGRDVCWEENGKRLEGKAADIDSNACLIVETPEGRRRLDSGMVSVRF